MNRTLMFVAALLLATACGGGGGADNPVGPVDSPPAVSSVTVVLSSAQVVAGTSTTASVELRAANGTFLSGRSVTWSSSATSVATVNEAGAIVAVSAGTSVITASSEGRSGSATLTVLPVPVSSISVSGTSTLVAGANSQFAAVLRDASGTELQGRSVVWGTSNPSVATVSASGLVTGITPGTATISANSEGRSGVATLTVLPVPVAAILVTGASAVTAGTTTQLSVTLRDANGTELQGRSVVWGTSNASIATVSASGLVTGVAPGSVTISANSEGKSGTATLTVLPVPVATIVVAGSSLLTPGATTQFSAILRDASGTMLQGRSVVWGTSNASIATVSASGLVTGITPGTATISANSEGRTGTLQIEVRSPVVSVTLTGASRVKVGDSYQYSATARTSDGSVVFRPVTWGTTNAGAGTFTPSGLLTPASTGTITIVATIDGVAWEAPITAYDWQSLSGSGSLFATLPSDEQITSRSGSSEYPELTFACSSTGSFVAWVATQRFVTENGIVAFSFDGAPSVAQTWLEFDNFRALGKTGTNASVKSFAIQMAGARLFRFAFGEFRGTTKVVSFRVTGFAPRLTPLLDACPGNNIQSAVADAMAAAVGMQSSIEAPSPELVQLRQERTRAQASSKVPSLGAGVAASQGEDVRTMRRRK